jgi:hypothetical protein
LAQKSEGRRQRCPNISSKSREISRIPKNIRATFQEMSKNA